MTADLEVLQRALERERAARKQAEALLEQKSRELFDYSENNRRVLEGLVAERTKELEVARDQALSASRAKSQFLANMSHELRTPLNAILGYSEMLEEDARADQRERDAEDLRKIMGAGKHLLALINDILDLSKIEAGQFEIHRDLTELNALIDETVSTVKPVVERNGNRLVLDVAAELGSAFVDGTKVRQALFNLLSNAAKFTKDGEVRLCAKREADVLSVSVSDTGIGMSEQQMSGLFQPFRQAAPETARKYGGTGLGLAISQRFAGMMGGSIRVASVLGEGSTFTLTLPLEHMEEAPKSSSRSRGQAGRGTVLVIDDDPMARDLLVRVLEAEGFSAVEARDGRQGLELARALRPVGILLDVVMPRVDGWRVLADLRADPLIASVPVIVVSVLGDRAFGLSMGAAEYLIKPVDRDTLARVLNRHVRPKATVLVVDDDPEARSLMSRAVEDLGYAPVLAHDGKMALAALAAQKPQLILLDLMMPELDGFGVLESVRKDPATQNIPVVVMTAKDLTEEDRQRLSGAVSSVLAKGQTPVSELSTLMRSLVVDSKAEG